MKNKFNMGKRCVYCYGIFSTPETLKVHQNNTKYCLKLQEEAENQSDDSQYDGPDISV